MAWEKLTSKTLTGTSDTITTDSFSGKKFIQSMSHILNSGNIYNDFRINSNSGSVYAQRRSTSGAADSTSTSQSLMVQGSETASYPAFNITYFCGVYGEEKLAITFLMYQNTAGAANGPIRNELACKSTDTNLITILNYVNGSTGDFAADSNVSALGTN